MKKGTINYRVEGKKVTALIMETFNKSYLEVKYGLRLDDRMFGDLRHKYLDNYLNAEKKYPCGCEGIMFEGVAKCSDNDTFSESRGKEIARNRVMIKYLGYVRYLLRLKESISGAGTIEQSIKSYRKKDKGYKNVISK